MPKRITDFWRFFSFDMCPEKSLEDKEMDVFLVDVNKKSIGENIRRNNRKKKLQRESANQDNTSDTLYAVMGNSGFQ